MFRNDEQRSKACRALLATLFSQERLTALWNDAKNEPSDWMLEICISRGGVLSHGEQVLVHCAMDFWNGEGGARFDEVIYKLDGQRLAAVATLMLAMNLGACAIDEWITSMECGDHFLAGEPAREVGQLLNSFDGAMDRARHP